MSLIIAVPRERRTSERRVALDPSRVDRLLQAGLQVHIEAECGHTASFHDDDYAGTTVFDNFAELVRGADIVVKVVCPTLEEIGHLRPGTVLVCIMSAFQHLEEVEALRRQKITVIAMDHMPRTTRAQPMDALSSQATVAGYKAALLAAELSPRMFPMLTTAAGTIRPSRVLVIGAGVAGLQAIATARRLGAQVEGYDIRRAAKEQIESLGARTVDTGVEVEGAGGLARALRKDEKQKQHDVLARHLARAHVVICAASIPGRSAPKIITEDMVDGMLPESVIVDLAASTGGNCELTHIGEHYYHNETLIVGPLNLPSHGAVHASEMYARNVHSMLQLIIRDSEIVLDPSDDIIARSVVCHDERISHGPTAGLLEAEHVPFGSAVRIAAELPDQSAGWLEEPEERPAPPEAAPEELSHADNDSSDSAPVISEPATPQSASGEESATAQASLTGALPPAMTEPPQAPTSHADGQANAQAADEGLQPAASTVDAGTGSEAEAPPADDLTRIEGVGPALQERLYAFGFRQFSDIAVLDDEGVQKLTVKLDLEDEVEKQNWPEQARKLMQEKLP